MPAHDLNHQSQFFGVVLTPIEVDALCRTREGSTGLSSPLFRLRNRTEPGRERTVVVKGQLAGGLLIRAHSDRRIAVSDYPASSKHCGPPVPVLLPRAALICVVAATRPVSQPCAEGESERLAL